MTISAVTLPGTSLAQSDELGRAVERAIMAHPEVTGIARRTGRAELDEHAQGVESAELDVSYTLPPGRAKAEFLGELRRDLSTVPGMNITVGQPIAHRIDHMLSGSRSNVAVKVFGDDLYRLRSLGERVRRVMAEVPGVVDLAVEPQVDIPTVEVRLDRAAIARHGLTVDDVTETLETAFRGRDRLASAGGQLRLRPRAAAGRPGGDRLGGDPQPARRYAGRGEAAAAFPGPDRARHGAEPDQPGGRAAEVRRDVQCGGP